ncbi:hypothetical protein J437_LFUL002718 [Ladona fulva]|uniref:Uncharacterized protein n=1 Tax=Ladona fulva TaxID=123851 RepID=A0A8K0P044_LADFU|nr:hypothetical protein J437_LFUL002718 [Ladona fulva]
MERNRPLAHTPTVCVLAASKNRESSDEEECEEEDEEMFKTRAGPLYRVYSSAQERGNEPFLAVLETGIEVAGQWRVHACFTMLIMTTLEKSSDIEGQTADSSHPIKMTDLKLKNEDEGETGMSNARKKPKCSRFILPGLSLGCGIVIGILIGFFIWSKGALVMEVKCVSVKEFAEEVIPSVSTISKTSLNVNTAEATMPNKQGKSILSIAKDSLVP